MADTIRIDNLGYLIVQDQWFTFVIDNHYRVRDLEIEVAQYDDPHVLNGHAESTQGNVFRDGVVFAVSVFIEELNRRRPIILLAVIYGVDDVINAVEKSVHLVDLIAQWQRSDFLQEGVPFPVRTAIDFRHAAISALFPGAFLVALHDTGPFTEFV